MTADAALADILAWVAAHGLPVAAAGLALAAWTLWLHSPRRRQQLTIAELRADLAAARLVAATERHNAAVAMRLANQAQAYAAEVVADRDREIQHIEDRLQCALLELGTDWETQP